MIVLRFFTVVIIMLIVVKIINSIFNSEQKRCNDKWYEGTEKYKNAINKIANIMAVILKAAIVTFIISNIVILIYGIINKYVIFIIASVMFFIVLLFNVLIEHTDKFPDIVAGSYMITVGLYTIFMVVFFFTFQALGTVGMQNDRIESIKVNTINIIELQKVPYTNVSGSRYYIRSEPSLAYYYDIETAEGRKTTKVIDGHKDYVERCEDDIYKDNPHIDVYVVVEKYTNAYGIEIETFKNYAYYIYIPKDSTYFVDKE